MSELFSCIHQPIEWDSFLGYLYKIFKKAAKDQDYTCCQSDLALMCFLILCQNLLLINFMECNILLNFISWYIGESRKDYFKAKMVSITFYSQFILLMGPCHKFLKIFSMQIDLPLFILFTVPSVQPYLPETPCIRFKIFYIDYNNVFW